MLQIVAFMLYLTIYLVILQLCFVKMYLTVSSYTRKPLHGRGRVMAW